LISAVAPWAITVCLIIGGLFLCYEGFEKDKNKGASIWCGPFNTIINNTSPAKLFCIFTAIIKHSNFKKNKTMTAMGVINGLQILYRRCFHQQAF